ncbi:MAG: prepilin-type N-terminal cleavage/methylation domain-containing protein [Candidatus Omnitrophica bacterium]|nr:prepilin-type N-terminal cleavage/methylation domain-containing protein [Candidatus Omnitrophota bacterium]
MNIRTHKALTLTELLVATILMGIVMAGVASFSLVVKQAGETTSSGTVLAIQTATAMRYIKEDALSAVGDNSNRGVVPRGASNESICFRHDTNDPTSYADDTWACYWYDAASDALWKCVILGALPTVFGDCNPGGAAIKLVTLDPDPGPPVAAQYFSVVDDADGRFGHVEITLNTLAKPAQVADPIKNPGYQLTTTISPPAHGH